LLLGLRLLLMEVRRMGWYWFGRWIWDEGELFVVGWMWMLRWWQAVLFSTDQDVFLRSVLQ
jgi:hypothetical protein